MVAILNRIEEYYGFKTPVIWSNVFFVSLFYLLALYSLTFVRTSSLGNTIFVFGCGLTGCTAVSAGAHRLWSHRTYKATLPLRFFIMLCYMMAGQYSIVQWARDHRSHHANTDTDADPHSAERGLLYSHCGWLMMRRHPDHKSRRVDVQDLWEDPVIRFHQKHFKALLLLVHVIFPSAVGYFVFGESLKNVVFLNFILRYMVSLNLLWCTNSLAHYWGYKPYNKNIRASGNAVLAFFLVGEGWHNFHHTFPWDYRAAERGQSWQFASHVIELCAWLGLASDLKFASPDLVQKVRARNLPKNFEAPEKEFADEIFPEKNSKSE